MLKSIGQILSLLIILTQVAFGIESDSLHLEHADIFEVQIVNGRLITFVKGDVLFITETGTINCDSARWSKGKSVVLLGNVIIDDEKYKLVGDSVYYNILGDEGFAYGKHVELWSYADSLYATGSNAYYSEKKQFFYMKDRPVFYINYPDSSEMVEIIADELEYNAEMKRAEGIGDVIITSNDFSSRSGCAIMNLENNDLDLFEDPIAKSGESEISGKLISISFNNKFLHQIDVLDSANAEINQPTDSLETDYDKSILKGNRLLFDFAGGILYRITCYGQAYSWYYPALKGGTEFHENSVSGDTIKLAIFNKKLSTVRISGGSVGRYITGKKPTLSTIPQDTLAEITDTTLTEISSASKIDTIDYKANMIEYDLLDSTIQMQKNSWVKSGTVSLDAHHILFKTNEKMVEAYSAVVSSEADTSDSQMNKIQPNSIPVVLRDKSEEIYGDFLEYSIESAKGRIVQSKTSYEEGIYYGSKLFREQEDIFYVEDGRYTTCNADEPHFQFRSKNMKLIENDKLIARPVVFYIERLPVAILPFYIFPLKRGRHSGMLPFSFGKFQRGDRYVKDVGYYWAASDYIDFKSAFDYHEKNQTMIIKSQMNFKKLYVLDGYFNGEYARETKYEASIADETSSTRWITKGIYNHNITPSFSIRAYGDFQSDKSYYTDYSQNINDRLNRQTKSKLNFSKKFGKNTAISGQISHTVNLDDESRSNLLPSLGLSLPPVWIFGSGTRNEDGKLEQKWYNKMTFRYTPKIENFSSRITLDSLDSFIDGSGTDITDTLSYRSRKKYSKISHNPSINLPTVTLLKYFQFNPNIKYSETWFKIHETDQSIDAGLDAETTYRTYQYNAGISLKTNLYGTLYPNIGGLLGLRHVITPSVAYGYSPDINKHPDIRSFAGGGAGSSKRSSVSFSIKQLFQGKVLSNELEKNLDLLSLNSSFSYNFEADERPLSTMSTSFQSAVLRLIKFDGRMTHSFYNPFTDEQRFLSPYIENFNFNARMTLAGSNSIFDDFGVQEENKKDDSQDRKKRINNKTSNSPQGRGWSLSANYSYSETGRAEQFVKRNFLRISFRFNLTPSTSVSYSQSYNIHEKLTVNNSVNIIKKIHCWTGSIFWVPIGSNRGFGFKLFVTALPEIKLDSSHDSFLESISN